jgi:hypothetical protein
MHHHPDPHGQTRRPPLSPHRPLHRHRTAQRSRRIGEHRAKRLAHRREHPPAGSRHLLADNAIQPRRRDRHRLPVGFPQPDSALNIGEQQPHRPRGKPHRPIVHPDPGTRPRPSAGVRGDERDRPGDKMEGLVRETGTNKWVMTVFDLTTGKQFSRSVR